jgi:hypothetical protein
MSERGVVSMWCGGVRSVTDGWPCCSSWRVVGRLVSFCGGFGVVDDGGFGRGRGRCMCVGGREAGWLRGRWVLPLTVCLQAWWQLLPCPAHSRQMCVRNSHALHAHAHSQTARQPDSQTARQTDRHAHTPALVALQPASPPARPPSRQPAIAAAVPLGSSHCVRSVRSCSSSGRHSWRRRRRRPSLMLQSSRVGFGHVCTYHLD